MNRFYELNDLTCIDLSEVCLVSHPFENSLEPQDASDSMMPLSTEPAYSFDIVFKSGHEYIVEHEDVRELKRERKKLISAWRKHLKEEVP